MYIFLQVASRHFEPTSIDLPTVPKKSCSYQTHPTNNLFYSGEDFHEYMCIIVYIYVPYTCTVYIYGMTYCVRIENSILLIDKILLAPRLLKSARLPLSMSSTTSREQNNLIKRTCLNRF